MKPCEEYGHLWKPKRKDKQITDEGTVIIIYFKCKICGAEFNTAGEENEIEEKDYAEKEIFNGEEL